MLKLGLLPRSNNMCKRVGCLGGSGWFRCRLASCSQTVAGFLRLKASQVEAPNLTASNQLGRHPLPYRVVYRQMAVLACSRKFLTLQSGSIFQCGVLSTCCFQGSKICLLGLAIDVFPSLDVGNWESIYHSRTPGCFCSTATPCVSAQRLRAVRSSYRDLSLR